MNKSEFLLTLTQRLSDLPWEEANERWAFYNEMIDDRMEEGLTEEEAVAAMGNMDEIIAQILSEAPRTAAAAAKKPERRSLRAWEIVLLVLGAPLWLSLLLAAFAVILSIYIVLWSLVLSLWAVEASFVGCALGFVLGGVILTLTGHPLAGFALLAAALVCAGLSIFLFFGCRAVTKGLLLLTKKPFTRSAKKEAPSCK